MLVYENDAGVDAASQSLAERPITATPRGPEMDWACEPVLSIEFSTSESRCALTMRGALTRTSIAALEVQIDQIGCAQCEEVFLDVTELRALDQVGARILVNLDRYVRQLGAQLIVFGARGRVAQMLATLHLLPPGPSDPTPRGSVYRVADRATLSGTRTDPESSEAPSRQVDRSHWDA